LREGVLGREGVSGSAGFVAGIRLGQDMPDKGGKQGLAGHGRIRVSRFFGLVNVALSDAETLLLVACHAASMAVEWMT
jgi:hypothetical protein